MSTPPEPVYCANPDHARPVKAVSRLFWPDNRFRPTTACVGCMERAVRSSLDEGHVVMVEPVHEHEQTPYRRYNAARQIRELSGLHYRAYSEPVRAILLEAPDHPHYEELPETLEERRKLPARFHVPRWTETGSPQLWVCAVCWDDGTVTKWPCEAAMEHGGEVLAR